MSVEIRIRVERKDRKRKPPMIFETIEAANQFWKNNKEQWSKAVMDTRSVSDWTCVATIRFRSSGFREGGAMTGGMNDTAKVLYHGGIGGLWPGSVIRSDMAHTRYLDNCPQCEAQRAGDHFQGFDPPTPHGFVYATTERDYARYYASRAVKGWLYEVELAEGAEPSTEDHFPTWRASSARVVKVLEKRIALTMDERLALFVRWGGTAGEFSQMLFKQGGFSLQRQAAEALKRACELSEYSKDSAS